MLLCVALSFTLSHHVAELVWIGRLSQFRMLLLNFDGCMFPRLMPNGYPCVSLHVSPLMFGMKYSAAAVGMFDLVGKFVVCLGRWVNCMCLHPKIEGAEHHAGT